MASKGKAKGRRGFIILGVGLILVILGVLWMTVLWPTLTKLPTSLNRTAYFDGNVTVPDQANPGKMITFPVEQVVQLKGNGTQDGALFIHETYIMNDATGKEIPAYHFEETMAVDRKTLKIVPEIDEQHGSGYWAPPSGLGEGDTFDLWNAGGHRALAQTYVRDDTFRGMKVVIFMTDEKDISLGNDSHTQLPLLYDVVVILTIDPKTGAVVDEYSKATFSLVMGGQKVPVQIIDLQYAERTIIDTMDTAKSAGRMLLLLGTVLPWVLIGVGAVLVVISIVFIRRGKQT